MNETIKMKDVKIVETGSVINGYLIFGTEIKTPKQIFLTENFNRKDIIGRVDNFRINKDEVRCDITIDKDIKVKIDEGTAEFAVGGLCMKVEKNQDGIINMKKFELTDIAVVIKGVE